MRSATIHKLAWYIPLGEYAEGDSMWEGLKGLDPKKARQILHFANCYKNMQFGWDVAKTLAETGTPFPAILQGDDIWVWRAYNYIKGADDPVINLTLALQLESNCNTRKQIEALLVADGVDCSFVSRKLRIPEDVVKAYEKLFFNVLDRKEDHSFIANLVYPNGRMVEALEGYLENTDLGTLMLRAGYTKGIEHVLYAAAVSKSNPYANRDAATGAAELDAMFMAEGCLYADMGWLSQHKHGTPIANARLSMQASKMGNNDAIGNASGVVEIHSDLRGELIDVTAMKMAARSRAMALDIVPEVPKNEFEDA